MRRVEKFKTVKWIFDISSILILQMGPEDYSDNFLLLLNRGHPLSIRSSKRR